MPSSTEIPAEFGDYQLLKEIGRGNAGVIYQAYQKSLDRIVALKMIQSGRFASREVINRFQAEAKAAAKLRHPNIVTIYEVGEVHGQHYFTMEYINGESLDSCIKRDRMSSHQSASLLSAVCRAVHHLHEEGIIHRDLKPSNIMLGPEGQPHVTDFGIAMMHRAGMKNLGYDAITGTPCYMAPEQASGNLSSITPQTDVYCLGGILYEMLVGHPPFVGEDLTDMLVQITERAPNPPTRLSPEIPRELEWICLRCLEKKPQRRYPSALALADDLDRFLRGEETETQPPTQWNRLRRWVRRAPALASRWFAMAIFFVNSFLNYRVFRIVEADFFVKTSAVIVAWIPICYIFHRWLQKEEKSVWARFGWACTDIVFFTAILLFANGISSPLVIGYPLLIVVSGLWFRTGLVWIMTGLAVVSYGVLILDSLLFRPELRVRFESPVIFLVSMGILGFIVAYQVGRIRSLERYYHRR